MKCIPVHPANLIILTVCVVIAVLAVAKLITGKNQRCSLAHHQEHERVADLLLSQSLDLCILGRTFRTAVVSVVCIGSVQIVLTIILIVFHFIGNHVHHGKSAGVCHVIDLAKICRILSGPLHETGYHALVTTKNFSHDLLEFFIVLTQIFFTDSHRSILLCAGNRFLLSLSGRLPVTCKQFFIAEERIDRHQLQRHLSGQFETVHMVLLHPVTQHIENLARRLVTCKVHFRNHFDSCTVELFDHDLQFHLHRHRTGTVGRLRRIQIGRAVSPEV